MVWTHVYLLLVTLVCVHYTCGTDWENINLPDEHIPYFFTNNPDIKQKCQEDPDCKYKDSLKLKKCWGYEEDCPEKNRMSMPSCPGESRGWARDKSAQIDQFWKAADFGYIHERRKELKVLCKPDTEGDSSLECASYTRFCRAKNIYMDFTRARLNEGRERFREDVFKDGVIGGHCSLDSKALKAEGEHKSPLQSWFAELETYSSLPFRPLEEEGRCEIIIDKPTYFMKLDAAVNMYHHFCDFINLYASLHVNNTFGTDVNIVMWDTSPMGYRDSFAVTWKAFTDHPIIELKDYDGYKVCFRDAVFSLLPRMRFGMYYNQPLIPGCGGSGFFRAFNQHLMHRLRIEQTGPHREKIRITLLARKTKYRNIMNEEELISVMKTVGEFEVHKAEFHWNMPFLDQLKVSHNTDILIGIHGAGLTHMLFQPDWAAVMEIYNCEDADCYKDLARSRGIKYMTWEKKSKLVQEDEGHHPTLGAHAKFTNYGFDVNEFMRLLYIAADHVRNHPTFIQERLNKYGPKPDVKDEL